MDKLPGPVYRTWDDAMSDPDLDTAQPWFVADPDAPAGDLGDHDWTGWTPMGATTDRFAYEAHLYFDHDRSGTPVHHHLVRRSPELSEESREALLSILRGESAPEWARRQAERQP